MTIEKSIKNVISSLAELSDLAEDYGLHDITQDNGLRTIQIISSLDLVSVPGRGGNDAVSKVSGLEFEIKTADINKVRDFGTSHHLTESVLDRYKDVPWIFGFFDKIELAELYVVSRRNMKPMLEKWSAALSKKDHLNNPKVTFAFVKKYGSPLK